MPKNIHYISCRACLIFGANADNDIRKKENSIYDISADILYVIF